MPDILPFKTRDNSPLTLLNVGCGRHFDARWCNIDIESSHPSVIKHDVTEGLPFEEEKFDVVYHSHVLEHLKPNLGRALLADCWRVLKPGGILRVVVPDLERIAELYLQTHHNAWNGDVDAGVNYNWMKLELIDQMVRENSGGRMGRYMASPEIRNSEFVRSRVGDELQISRAFDRDPKKTAVTNWRRKFKKQTRRWREKICREFVRLILGQRGARALGEGLFRSRGEIHRWMYDRYSLRQLCHATGFVNCRVCSAIDSDIEHFVDFSLDAVDGQVRKPDSLFIECRKPRVPAAGEKVA